MSAASYAEFSSFIHQFHAGRRAPMEVSIEVTRRCPLACQHCYNNLPMGDLEARSRELSKEEYFSILDELAEMGTLWVLFTGGEIFARKDFLEIYTYAKRKGFLITLFTNGTLINEKIVDYLVEWRPFAIEITLYGLSAESYEAMTAIPGSHARCMRGIHLLLDRGLPLKLKTVPTSLNKHEVMGMKQFAAELGVEFKFDSLINPRLDCSQSPLAVRLSPEDVVALDLHSAEVRSEYAQMAQRELNMACPVGDGDKEHSQTVYSCGGGLKAFALDPYGNMSICVISQQELYNVRSGSVREGWEKFLLQVRNKERKRITKCVDCRIHSLCSMCPANGELEHGDPESPVNFLCEVAHLRAAALGLEVPAHGDCEYCGDGVHHEAMAESAQRIRGREIDVTQWVPPQALLPILRDASSVSAGCGGSCGAS